MKKTKVYFTKNGIPQYLEFDEYIPFKNKFYQVKDIPGNLWELLVEDQEYKFCRDDGPAVVYKFGSRLWKSSKCDKHHWGNYLKLNNWSRNTNHLICEICMDFCNQQCF